MRSDDLCDPEQAFIGRTMPPRGEVWEPEAKPCGDCEREPCECPRCYHCGERVECEICHGRRVWISKEGFEIPCDFCPVDIEGHLICAACRAEYGRA